MASATPRNARPLGLVPNSLRIAYKRLFRLEYRRFRYTLLEYDPMETASLNGGGGLSEKQISETRGRLRWCTWSRKRLYLLAAVISGMLVLGLGLGFGLYFGRKHITANYASASYTTHSMTFSATVRGPVISSNFADPCYIIENGTHYAFATNKYKELRPGQIHIQLAVSDNFETWTLTSHDALPDPGPWAAADHIWAPDVVKLDDGSFVLYYAARVANIQSRFHCVGAAVSKKVEGPYTPLKDALACPLSKGGAIDPEGFRDADGTRYLIYKVDGNSFTFPGGPRHPTPLMLQKVAADGVTLVGDPIQIMDREASDGPLIEAPAMGLYDTGSGKDPLYVLFFSSNVFTTASYNVLYATSHNVAGPFVRGHKSLLTTGDGPNGQLVGPGSIDVGVSSRQIVFHSIDKSDPSPQLIRHMWTGQLTLE